MYKVLTIAGSDSSGGAGIQADIKTVTAHGMYAMSAITSLTAQNTLGVFGISDVSPDFLAKQLDCIFEDIFPDAVKIGMVSSAELIEVIAQKLERYKPKNIVIDPVMVSTSGSRLLSKQAEQVLVSRLLPLGRVITPNIPEAETLCGFNISDEGEMIAAAEKIAGITGGAVLVKGGHMINDASDYLLEDGVGSWYRSQRINNPNTHGTGCTLSSAIACNLAAGKSLGESIKNAKEFLVGALKSGLDLGHGSGPLNHMFNIKEH